MSGRSVPDSVAALTEEFVGEIRKLYKERLNRVILFGTYARGDQTQDSDVDYLVVLNDEEIRSLAEIRFISAVTNSLGLKYDLWISAVPITISKLDLVKSPLNENVKQEGIVL